MKDMSLQASSTRLAAGTPAYMAPETFEGCAVTDKSDVYAFGVLLWEVCAQQQPWRELSAMQVICAVGVRAERLPRPPRCPDGMWALVTACWDHCPHARPSFDAVLHTLRRLQRQLVAVEDDVDAHVAVVW
jgi:serine/threonine protein kinase